MILLRGERVQRIESLDRGQHYVECGAAWPRTHSCVSLRFGNGSNDGTMAAATVFRGCMALQSR